MTLRISPIEEPEESAQMDFENMQPEERKQYLKKKHEEMMAEIPKSPPCIGTMWRDRVVIKKQKNYFYLSI